MIKKNGSTSLLSMTHQLQEVTSRKIGLRKKKLCSDFTAWYFIGCYGNITIATYILPKCKIH